jgi:hypothetical protein
MHETVLAVPDASPENVKQLYDTNFGGQTFDMPYTEIVNGGTYCTAKGSTAPLVTVGGMFFWEGTAGECVLPPVDAAGAPCCTVYMWQPNTGGLYYDNCSMQCAACLPATLPACSTCLPACHPACLPATLPACLTCC